MKKPVESLDQLFSVSGTKFPSTKGRGLPPDTGRLRGSCGRWTRVCEGRRPVVLSPQQPGRNSKSSLVRRPRMPRGRIPVEWRWAVCSLGWEIVSRVCRNPPPSPFRTAQKLPVNTGFRSWREGADRADARLGLLGPGSSPCN